jgi:hypothetical protein
MHTPSPMQTPSNPTPQPPQTDYQVAQLIQMVQQLQQQLLTLQQQHQQQPVQHPFQPNPHPPTFCPPKVNPPQEFNGDRSKTSSFISQCELVFCNNPHQFPTFEYQIIYSCSYLCVPVFTWYEHLDERTQVNSWHNWNNLLFMNFGNSNITLESRVKLQKLIKDGQHGPCHKYVTAFNHL